MFDETRSKPVQHENCVEWAWKSCMKCKVNGPVLLHRNIHFTKTPHIYICILSFRNPLPCNSFLKGRFPLGEMNGNFTTKFIWACAFWFVYSLAGKIFLFKICDEKSRHNCQTNQNTNFQFCHQINFHQIKSKMAANNMSIIHVSPNVLSTLIPLQQENLLKLQLQILHDISRGSRL